MRIFRIISSSSVAVFAIAVAAAYGQDAPSDHQWTHGTSLSGFAGVATASSQAGAMIGGTIGWEVTPRIGIEGSGSWLDRTRDAEATTASLKAVVNVLARRPVVPFLAGGIGMYHASFDRSLSVMPEFYRRRATDVSGMTMVSASFTDPSFVVGGGVNVFASRHVAIRPEFEATIVRRDSESYVVTSVALRFAYHFEDHPITP